MLKTKVNYGSTFLFLKYLNPAWEEVSSSKMMDSFKQ